MCQINKFDTIRTLQYKNLLCSYEMIGELIKSYREGSIKINNSSKDFDYLYAKVTPQDGKIDFRMRTNEINLIRALTKPFDGDFASIENQKDSVVAIWDAVPFDSIIDFSKYNVGEVIEAFDLMLIVSTLDGSLMIKKYEYLRDIAIGGILQWYTHNEHTIVKS